jgi:Concanavalin A-like lectin/glucanases superfamily/Conserved hypothetical protein 2217 (DUF2460)
MAETPTLYCPDYPVQFSLQQMLGHRTEVMESRSGREQRRGVYVAAGRRRYVAKSIWFTNHDDRRSLFDFFQTMRGRLTPFYFWQPEPATINNPTTGMTFGTTYGGDTWHQPMPWKGAFNKGGADVEPTYPTIPTTTLSYVQAAGFNQQIQSSQCLIPRGNNYCALAFNGINSYANAGAAAATRITGDQTWMAWVFLRPNDASSDWRICTNETGNASGITFGLISGRQIFIEWSYASGSGVAFAAGTVPLNTWTHIAVVRSGTNITFYINGVASGTATWTTNPATATISLIIGAGGADNFHGMINDLRVYSVAQTATAITGIMNGVALFDSTPAIALLQGWWKMTDGRGISTIVDSANGYNAAIVNYGDDLWVGGEDEVAITGPQTGAVVVPNVQNARPRITARFDMDEIQESFLESADITPAFDIAIREVI